MLLRRVLRLKNGSESQHSRLRRLFRDVHLLFIHNVPHAGLNPAEALSPVHDLQPSIFSPH